MSSSGQFKLDPRATARRTIFLPEVARIASSVFAFRHHSPLIGRQHYALLHVLAGPWPRQHLFSSPALADDPPISPSPEPATTIAVGDVTYRLPFAFPSGEEIFRELPAKVRPKNARIQCELFEYRLDAPRYYPKVGPARLANAHFKCTVFTGKSSEVVYIDRNFLVAEN
jgi:hypothetical protein